MSDQPQREPNELTPEQAKLMIKAIEEAEREEAESKAHSLESKST